MGLTDTAAASDQVTAASGVATGTTSFSPGAGSMVVVQWVWLFSSNTLGVTFTVADNHGNTYSVPDAPNNDGAGATYVGSAYFTYSSAPGTTTVKVTASNTGAAGAQITARLVTGQAASPVGATLSANNGGTSTGTLTGSITTTTTGSQVYWSVGLNANSASVSAASGNTLFQFWNNSGLGEGAATGKVTAQTGTPGTVTAGATCSPASGFGFGIHAWEVLPGATGHPAAAALSGSGSVTVSRLVTQPAAAALSGSGSVTAAPAVSILPSAALFGEGFVTAGASVLVPGAGAAALSGSGTVTVSRQAVYQQAVPLTGTGTIAAGWTGIIQQAVPLSGSGTASVAAAATLKFTAGLFGAGFISIPQVAGGLVNGVGGAASPMALPGSSQVAVAPPGSTNWQWLGTLGQVTALTYSYVCPGGADKMTCTVMAPASYQSQLFYPGWQVKIVRGGHDIWHGKLDQPSYQPRQGWTLTAVGNGNRGQDFNAYFAINWPGSEPDEVLNRAIIRGLPWVNPGYNGASFASQFWLGQSVDAASQKVSDFLNMICSRGGLTWYVNSQPGGIYGGDDLQIFPLPTTPTRLLVATAPVPRTLGGYVNYIAIRYQSSGDSAGTTAATYSYTSVSNPQSIAAHGQLEAFFDLSDASVMTAAQAQAVGNHVLQIYVAASFGGPFQVSYGQLLNMGGQPVDIGCDGAGMMVKLVLADSAYGGSVDVSQPVTFLVGSYEYNDITQTAQVSPYATVNQSLSGLLSMENQALKPVTVASS